LDALSVAFVTGSAGLIGSESVRHFASLGFEVVGVDNDLRSTFFGADASTAWNARRLCRDLGPAYTHLTLDIRDRDGLARAFRHYGDAVSVVIHTAAQPSHDWAARDPFTDFDVNATGTLNLLQNVREHCPEAPFVHCSTNKVYGDRPNDLPLVELDTRFELAASHPYSGGVPEEMPVDASLHSLFGASKLAADVLVQEYGRYFGMRTACFRAGTLTGPAHSAAHLHGFLGYLMRCAMTRRPYTVIGYGGKQVRDAIHSRDVVRAFEAFRRDPRPAAVYNLGGGRHANCSVLEAIELVEKITGEELERSFVETPRTGDHRWWIGSNARFTADHPGWRPTYDVVDILYEIHDANRDHWTPTR
jgi:CDP-paratose 2-epimerase